ncbi:MAG: PriCT-2 domain-containing protein [Prevotella sp.]|jgi:hypothetical protein|nr:PriCT-2 domain-containing protein [Prevotella sp.]
MQQFEMSYFCPPITNKVPSRTVTLLEVARLISSEALRPQTETLRSISDKAEARAYKGRCLPYVTPSGVFTYCNDQSLVSHSNALCIDLDHVKDVALIRQLLVADRHFVTLLSFRSPSGDGLKWFLLMDLSAADHRTWFQAVRNYLLATYKDLTKENVDSHVGNLSRACFLCYDPEVYVGTAEIHVMPAFDPVAWAAKTAEPAKKPAAAKRQTGVTGQPLHPVEELAKAKAVVRELLQRGANIADAYGDYLKLGFSLASGLGSEGHDLYHQLCSQSPKYNEADCERKWQECISKSDGRTTLATFYSMAKQAGIDLSRISREFKPETIYHF